MQNRSPLNPWDSTLADRPHSDAFTELRTGAPPRDKLALLTVLLADGLNMGLGKMARACQDYSVWELTRLATWHVRQETYERALAMVVAAQAAPAYGAALGRGPDIFVRRAVFSVRGPG